MDYKDDARHDPMLNEDIAAALGLARRRNWQISRRLH